MAQVFSGFKAANVPSPIKGNGAIIKETPLGDCSNEHLSNSRDLLTYYQFHVRAIEGLIKHHEETERKLKESEKSRKALKDRLDNTENELGQTKAKLEETENNLTHTLKELRDSQCEHKDTNKTTDKLKSTEKNLKQAKDGLNEMKHKFESSEGQLRDTQAKLSSLEEEKASLAERYKELNISKQKAIEERDEANERADEADKRAGEEDKRADKEDKRADEADKRAEEAKKRAKTLQSERDGFDQKAQAIQKQYDDLLKISKSNSSFIHRSNRTRGDIYIDEIMYGGTVINDQKVINKLLDYAESNKEFTITNDLMGGDTWRGTTKSFTAVYAVGKKGPFKYISQQEYQKVRFYK
ncbi:MAG: hypothetical protein Q9190_000387 [Brigantiaea leucoxantha]